MLGPAPGRQAVNDLELPGQLWRLGQFRARNPGVMIRRDAGFGFWQAWIPVSNGGTVITRYVLQDLLGVGPEYERKGPRSDPTRLTNSA
jgi:hypothetical protein